MSARSAILLTISTCLFSFLTVPFVAADVRVIENNGAGFKTNETIVNSDRLMIPEGASLKVMSPSGATRTIVGPVDQRLGEYLMGQAGADGMLEQFVKQLSSHPETKLGATRGRD